MKIVTFGEIMLRLAPVGYNRFVQADSFGVSFGGGEANVAVSLAGFNEDAAFITKLPENDLGRAAQNSLRRYGVDVSKIALGGKRLGIYFLEKGASQRPSKVIYDRADSAIAQCGAADFDWARLLPQGGWFHFTGITPALSQNAFEACLNALKEAKQKNMTVSCDLNYRKNLWTRAEAQEKMTLLMPYVDVCIANEEDAKDVFGISAENTDITGGRLSGEGYKAVAERLKKTFGFKAVAITLRESISASDNIWGALLYDGKEHFFSKKYPVRIVDRVGGGDSFGAGLIYAMIHNFSARDCIEFAVAASCLKHTIEGDFNLCTVEEVKKLAEGDGSGRVQR